MTETESLARFGLRPAPADLPIIRAQLVAETSKERASQGRGDTDLMRVCCVQLFFAGEVEDCELIASAKSASMDANGAIDVQWLCGAGLAVTTAWLAGRSNAVAAAALRRIREGEGWGEFDEFTVEAVKASEAAYYGWSPPDA